MARASTRTAAPGKVGETTELLPVDEIPF